MAQRKKRKRVGKLHRAILALCRLQRKQIEELGHLRVALLEIRDAGRVKSDGWRYP